MNTDNNRHSDAKECLDRLRSRISAAEFGYKIQAVSAHVLLGLGYSIRAINHTGHPDIVATRGGAEFLFEVEAEVSGPRLRKLDNRDFKALTDRTGATGYYALAIIFPKPYWIVVPAFKLMARAYPNTNILLEALSDKELSSDWTIEYQGLLQRACRQITLGTFEHLSQLALAGSKL